MRKHTVLLAFLTCFFTTATALADPPPWAPANGHGEKGARRQEGGRRDDDRYRDHDRDEPRGHVYRGYTGTEWADDYGVSAGRCNSDSVLTAVGAISGAILGNSVASPGTRGIATFIGAVVGGVAGNAVGDAIDDHDRACMGHALEIAPVGHVVEWRNPHAAAAYYLTPTRDLQGGCREFELRDERRDHHRREMVTACRGRGGAWAVRR